jgi:hypothetical protein
MSSARPINVDPNTAVVRIQAGPGSLDGQ